MRSGGDGSSFIFMKYFGGRGVRNNSDKAKYNCQSYWASARSRVVIFKTFSMHLSKTI